MKILFIHLTILSISDPKLVSMVGKWLQTDTWLIYYLQRKTPMAVGRFGISRNELSIPIPDERRSKDKGSLKIVNGNVFNIKNMQAEIPLGKLVCITGVSGSGKSSFMYEIVHKNLQAQLERKYRTAKVFNCASLQERVCFSGCTHRSVSDWAYTSLKLGDVYWSIHAYSWYVRHNWRCATSWVESKIALFQCERWALWSMWREWWDRCWDALPPDCLCDLRCL